MVRDDRRLAGPEGSLGASEADWPWSTDLLTPEGFGRSLLCRISPASRHRAQWQGVQAMGQLYYLNSQDKLLVWPSSSGPAGRAGTLTEPFGTDHG